MLARSLPARPLGVVATAALVWLSAAARAQSAGPQAGNVPTVREPEPESDGKTLPPEKPIAWELAGQAAYVTPPIRGGANPFGAGFGARLGMDLSGLYLGLSVLDFLGSSDVDVSYRALLLGAEFGHDLRAPLFGGAFLLVRPRLGVGNAAVYYTDPSLRVDVVTSASGGSSSSSSDTLTVNNVYVQPGLTLEVASGGHFVAFDGSALVLPGIAYGGADSTTWISYGIQAQIGFRF